MTDDDEQRNGNGDGRFSRRSILGALGGGAGLASFPGPVQAGTLDSRGGGARLTDRQLARAGVERYNLGRIEEKTGCFKPDQRELYGPTNVNAQTANGRLAVGLNRAGTVTVFRWPRPSFFDQVKYFTRGRDADDDIVVAPNHGAFLGLMVDTGDGFETSWLREWPEITQSYASDGGDTDATYSDEVVTEYAHPDLGLRARVRALATEADDVLVRGVRVIRQGNSPVACARLVAVQNLGLVTEKVPQYPVTDWCLEEDNDHRARYLPDADAVVHDAAGVDGSTGEDRSVAVAVGFDGATAGHQVGGDAHDPGAEPTADAGPARDAYDDASDGPLSGNDAYVGQATSALSTDLAFGPGAGGVAEKTVYMTAEPTADAATGTLEALRETPFGRLRDRKEAWLADLLADAALPDREAIVEHEDEPTAETIMATLRRALVCLVTQFDRESGAVAASITTQPPYGQDWPRDGAFFNYVYHLLGLHERAEERCRWYADLQQQAAAAAAGGDAEGASHPSQPSSANTPPANWNMCYYADGVAGGPIPYQIDTTGLTTWALYDHFEATGDEQYLADVYPAIRRAADYLVECRDPRNDLQCHAWEDDRFFQPDRQTVNGAVPVWLALRSAARAAETLDRPDDAARYRQRQHELGQAIDRELYDATEGAYGTKRAGFAYSETVWPGEFTPYADPDADDQADADIHPEPQVSDPLAHPRIQNHLDTDARGAAAVFEEPDAGRIETGQYEAKVLIPLAKARRRAGEFDVDFVRTGVEWIATEHATPDTHVLGEAWQVFADASGDREVRSIIGQPHIWEQVLLYMAALEAYPPAGLEFDGDTVGGVLAALRETQRPG
jgi:hypothetical protein